jgi:hypothetical protein
MFATSILSRHLVALRRAVLDINYLRCRIMQDYHRGGCPQRSVYEGKTAREWPRRREGQSIPSDFEMSSPPIFVYHNSSHRCFVVGPSAHLYLDRVSPLSWPFRQLTCQSVLVSPDRWHVGNADRPTDRCRREVRRHKSRQACL